MKTAPKSMAEHEREFENLERIRMVCDPQMYKRYLELYKQDPSWANSWHNDLEGDAGAEFCHSLPKKIVLNLGPHCNIMCRFCSQTHFDKFLHDRGYDDEITVKTIDKFFGDVGIGLSRFIVLQGEGEPLMSPHYQPLFEYFRQKFPYSKIQSSTNGLPLTPELARFVVDNDMDWLSVSFNASSPEVYKTVTGIDGFKKLIENIRYLQTYKAEVGKPFPGVGASFIITRYNMADLPEFVNYCADLKVDAAVARFAVVTDASKYFNSVIHTKADANNFLLQAQQVADQRGVKLTLPPLFKDADDQNSEPPPVPEFNHSEYFRDYRRAAKKSRREGTNVTTWTEQNRDPSQRERVDCGPPVEFRCRQPWSYISIRGNGAAKLCEGHVGNENMNIFERGFWDTWNGPYRRHLRKTINSDRIDKACHHCPINREVSFNSMASHALPKVAAALQSS